MITRRKLAVAFVLCTLALVAQAASAQANTVTVCASGCDDTTIQAAVSAPTTNTGDTIEVFPGTYAEEVSVGKRLTIEGEPGAAMPVIASSKDNAFTVLTTVAGTVLQHLGIASGGAGAVALEAEAATTASDLVLTASGFEGECADLRGSSPSTLGPGVTGTASGDLATCIVAGISAADTVTGVTASATGATAYGATVASGANMTDSVVSGTQAGLGMFGGSAHRITANGGSSGIEGDKGDNLVTDSVATSTGANGEAVLASFGNPGPDNITLRNVTAIASGSGSHGLQASSIESGGSFGPGSINALDVIARGAGGDVVGQDAPSPCPGSFTCQAGVVTIGYSNFVTESGPVVNATHNQSADPLFVNGTVGPAQDFHLASAASPAIGAGSADASSGPSDRDGVPHPNPPSIGAYEFVPPPAGPPGGPPPPAAPKISALSETNSIFAVGRASTPLRGRTSARSHKRGTVFSFQLDQAATVDIAIRALKPGRRVGRRCVSPSPRLRRKRRCTRTVKVATLVRTAHAGLNKVPFSGRIRRKALRPGRYQAVFTPQGGAGARPASTLRFRIVKR
jgi:hypothetical protein